MMRFMISKLFDAIPGNILRYENRISPRMREVKIKKFSRASREKIKQNQSNKQLKTL